MTDDVLPLSKPLVTTSGESLAELLIPKGLRIISSLTAYNRYYPLRCEVAGRKLTCGRLQRNKDVFGEDSHIFDPERWLDSRVKKTSTIGLIGNLYVLPSDVVDEILWLTLSCCLA